MQFRRCRARGAVAGDEEKERGLEMRLELEEGGYKIVENTPPSLWQYVLASLRPK